MNRETQQIIIDAILHFPKLVARIRKLAAIHPRKAATPEGQAEIVRTIQAEARDLLPDGEIEDITVEAIDAIAGLVIDSIVRRYRNAAERAKRKQAACKALLNADGPTTKASERRLKSLQRERDEAKAMAAVWGSEP